MFANSENSKEQMSHFFLCLSNLEEHTAQLFKTLSEKVQDMASVSSRLAKIAANTEEHVSALRLIGKSIDDSEVEVKECKRKLSFVCSTIENMSSQIAHKDKITGEELLEIVSKLESSSGEEQFMLVQAKTFQYMGNELGRQYGVDFEEFQDLLGSIAEDEAYNAQLLAEIRELLALPVQKHARSPEFKYQNPDAWTLSLPANEYE
jgi:hypothetical protein